MGVRREGWREECVAFVIWLLASICLSTEAEAGGRGQVAGGSGQIAWREGPEGSGGVVRGKCER